MIRCVNISNQTFLIMSILSQYKCTHCGRIFYSRENWPKCVTPNCTGLVIIISS